MALSSVIFSMVQWNDFLSSMDVGMVDRTMLKPRVPLYGLFYLYVLELMLLTSTLPLAQQF